MALPDLSTASRKELIGEWRQVFKCREPEKAGAKLLRTCLQVQLERQGNIKACNKAHAKLISRLKRHEAGNGALRPRQASRPAQSLYEAIKGRHILYWFAVLALSGMGLVMDPSPRLPLS